MTEPTEPSEPSEHAERVTEQLDEPSPRTAPEPSRDTGATASERATAEATRELSEPERLDGSTGPAS